MEISGRVEDARAIQMDFKPRAMRFVADFMSQLCRINSAAGYVVSIFQSHKGSLRAIVRFLANGASNLRTHKNPVLRGHNTGQHAAESRHRTHLIVVNMS